MLADSLYPYHQLAAQDANTIKSPSGPVTFVPIPRNTGLLAGLLTVDLPTGVRRGDVYSLVVRQITEASRYQTEVLNRPQVGRKAKAVVLGPSKKVAFAKRFAQDLQTWRRVLGAFQVNIPISTKENLLVAEEHRFALFRWIADQVLPQSRWYPVMQRYVLQLAGRVSGFGGNPGTILPSPTGHIPGQPGGGQHEHHEHHGVTGKVSGLRFDHFGDFDGFSIETRFGEFRHFRCRERRVLEIVRKALEDRSWVTVVRETNRHDEVLSIIVRTPPPHHD